ncbi:MAG: hypothetical protein MI975_18250 [Cytophagales bacterium]|nr:hypothetical protein [Cytophagales bacterium]
MTKFDIRLRRKQFTQNRIERYKNYQSLMERHHEARKKKTRGVMVLVFLIIIIIAILLAFFGTVEQPETPSPDEHIGWNAKKIEYHEIEKSSVYKLQV